MTGLCAWISLDCFVLDLFYYSLLSLIGFINGERLSPTIRGFISSRGVVLVVCSSSGVVL